MIPRPTLSNVPAAEESVLWSTRNFEDGIASTNVSINDNDNDEFSERVSDERQVKKNLRTKRQTFKKTLYIWRKGRWNLWKRGWWKNPKPTKTTCFWWVFTSLTISRLRIRSPCVAISLDRHVGLNVATRACDVYPDKCWFDELCRFWLQCSRGLMHNDALHDFYSSPNTGAIESRWIRLAWHVAWMRKKRYACTILLGKPETTGLFRRPRRRWEVQGNHKEITLDGVQRIRLDKRWSLYARQGTFGFDNVRGMKSRWEATSSF